ncbi:MAG: type II toxin-antitoxin system VapC family toxin [Candidatus Bathyarchaeota archaeon]|jgi:predicted nucleic acid-binding protein|nr:type II toxin-antitoxin system VapC family toxin [Candidatus Bathyarchaeota archaeon]
MISIDSYGWIERLTNGPKAELYNAVIEKSAPNEIVTSAIVLYEVYKKIKQTVEEQSALEAVAAIGQTLVVSVDQSLSLEAADYSLLLGLHIADAVVYATARHYGAELYTSDEDLKGVKGVVYI